MPVLDGNIPIQLGSGGFSEVFLYVNKKTNKPVAVKILTAKKDVHYGSQDIPVSMVMGEIETNLKLKETNCVIPLLAVYKDTSNVRSGPIKTE